VTALQSDSFLVSSFDGLPFYHALQAQSNSVVFPSHSQQGPQQPLPFQADAYSSNQQALSAVLPSVMASVTTTEGCCALSEPLAAAAQMLPPSLQSAVVNGFNNTAACMGMGMQYTAALDGGVAVAACSSGPTLPQQQLASSLTTPAMLSSCNTSFGQQQQLPAPHLQMLIRQQGELPGYNPPQTPVPDLSAGGLPRSSSQPQQQQVLVMALQPWQVGLLLPNLQGLMHACGVSMSVAAGQGGLSQLTLTGTPEQLVAAQSLLDPMLQQ
jgi:hypothetical protein